MTVISSHTVVIFTSAINIIHCFIS